MSDFESSPQVPERPTYGREVLRYFMEEQSQNPNFMKGIVTRLWNGLSDVDRDAMSTAQAVFFPEDLVGRQNSLYAQLLADYIRTESEGLTLLADSMKMQDRGFEAPPSSGKDAA